MPWPTPQDYNEAIQSPTLCFDNPELRAGQPEVTPLGLPRPNSGQFASVYRIHSGQRDWAVKCFLNELSDSQERYAAIGAHLAAAKLPFMVGFYFLPKSIKVKGNWYPILKMEWVNGESLQAHIERNLHNQSALLKLAGGWVNMLKVLQSASISHGDLQHGNVLLSNGDFKLVDYDGMYVPALAGKSSHELGHRNYQHPLSDCLKSVTHE